ncbi:hypothetical protein KCU71_g9874, partial [Aureobasidium melanogenum]
LLAAANTFPYQSPRSTSETFGNGGTSRSGPARTGTSHSQVRSRLVSRSPAGRRPSNSTSGRGDGASSVTNSGAMRIEELKRVLAGQAPPSSAMSMHRAGAGDDSSESMMDVEDGELEDDASDYSPPPHRQATQDAVQGSNNTMQPPPAPALRLNSGEVVTNGTLSSAAPISERGRQDGLVNRPASRRVASRSSARGFGGAAITHGKKDLRDLLSSIGTEEEDVASGEGVSRAPY